MSIFKISLTVFLAFTLTTAPLAVRAQDFSSSTSDASTSTTPIYSQAQLDQMLAPIALYPDPLIGQILMASTYPLEIVEASRWLQDPTNTSLTGDQLASALDDQPWDPSVKAIVAVPQVLKMMDKNLQWTEQLGDAFLAQQADVTDSIQRLRQQAQASGSLNSTPQQVVSTEGSEIIIEPANPDVVYVPVYNPQVVYGAWAYPAYPPYYFYAPSYGWGPAIVGFSVGVVVAHSIWGWDHCDWRHHRIDIDDRRFAALNHGRPPFSPGVWHHNPEHRGGVPYRDPATRARFEGRNSSFASRDFRGYDNRSAPHYQTPDRHDHDGRFQQNMNNAHNEGRPPQEQHTVPAERPTPHEQHFAPVERPTAQAREPLARNIAPVRNAPSFQHFSPAPQRPTMPMTESLSHGANVRAESARGAASRSTPAPAPVMRAPTQAPMMHAPPSAMHAPPPSAPHGGGRPQVERGNDHGNQR